MQGLGPRVLNNFKWTQKTYITFPKDTKPPAPFRSGTRGAIFAKVAPTPVSDPELACYSSDVIKNILELDESAVEQEAFLKLVSGNESVPESECLAHRYGGHQFGSWADQLGDGRAHLIGEYTNSFTKERWELQLKGSGKTPYSRFGDGRAVVRSSVREFLCSEAMFHLGVPTSRAGTIVTSPDTVTRDPHYDGHPRQERSAIVLRLAPCWFRFGSFQMLAADGNTTSLALVADFVAERYYPEAAAAEGGERYVRLVRGIAVRTATMIARWENVGFTHGVMNTDNMSVLGITIDYGPYGFMDRYDSDFVPNSSDTSGVYRYTHQTRVGQWNICRLWEALMPLMEGEQHEGIRAVLEAYVKEYQTERQRLFAGKLGLKPTDATAELTDDLLKMMEATGADFTMTFRQLGEVTLDALQEMATAAKSANTEKDENATQQPTSAEKDASQTPSDTSTVPWALKTLLSSPGFADWLTDYRSELASQSVSEEDRQSLMSSANPRYILRQWMAHRAGEDAEGGDYTELRRLYRVLQQPFTEQKEAEEANYAKEPPKWSGDLSLSCSS